jgi:hypothetical protein
MKTTRSISFFIRLDKILRPRQLESNKKYSVGSVPVDSHQSRAAGNMRQRQTYTLSILLRLR